MKLVIKLFFLKNTYILSFYKIKINIVKRKFNIYKITWNFFWNSFCFGILTYS